MFVSYLVTTSITALPWGTPAISPPVASPFADTTITASTQTILPASQSAQPGELSVAPQSLKPIFSPASAPLLKGKVSGQEGPLSPPENPGQIPSETEDAIPEPGEPDPNAVEPTEPGNQSTPVSEEATPNEEEPAASVEQSAETEDELFERVFGRPRSHSQAVTVPFFINDQPQGQVIVLASGGRASQIQAAPLLDSTAPILQADLQTRLVTAVDSEGYLALDQLQQLGMAVIFDQSQLELYVQIPPALRQTNVIDPTGLPPEAAQALPISTVSGYVNILAGEDIVWSGSGRTGRQPLRLSFDGALNISGWVLEGQANWIEGADPAFTRGDLRLVHDDPANALRYVVGDLTIPVSGAFQTVVPLAGISVSRNYSIQPYRVTRPTGEFTFFLERPSRVDVYINGVRVQQLQLEPGPQDIRNLALSTGANDIQLVITDDLGQVQQLDFSAALAGSLLAPGLQQFSYNFGFPSETVNGQRQYQWEEPQLSLAHRWGVSSTLTVGVYTQLTPTFQMIETDGIWASGIGNWAWDVAASHTAELGTGLAARLQYELPPNAQDPASRTFRAAAEYRSDGFTTLGSTSPSDDWLILSAAYSQKIFDDASLNLGGVYRLGRDGPDTYAFNAGLSSSLGNNLTGSLNLNYSRDQTGQEEARVFLGLSWLLTEQNQSVSLNSRLSNTDDMSSQLTWSRSPERRIGGTGLSFDLSRGSQGYDLLGRLNYTDYRFELGLTQDISWPSQPDTTMTNTSRLTVGTALVFADGHFSWSRPINNSFVMVVPSERWRGQRIGVNPDQEDYLAVVDQFGPAVLPDLQPYYVSRVTLEAPEAPLGYDLGPNEYIVMPSYRSGTVIQAGTEATVFIRGVLVDESGAPIELQAGEVVSISDSDWLPQPLFTNRVGRFALMGLTPGQYEIRLPNRPPVSFEITPDQEGLVDLGPLR